VTARSIRSAADLDQRLRALRSSAGFQAYEQVRASVLQMLEQESARVPAALQPSDYWREELSNFEYLFDASPLLIDKLRHHCYPVTGLRQHDYRSHRDRDRARLADKLAALIEVGGRELLVPESPLLGGFGFEIDGALYNQDTLKFYEALIALDRAAVLAELRSGQARKLVWEIGAGWGGFAYQLKRLCPEVTYVITDFPELFLFSAVYLMTHFPGARIAFYGQESPEGMFERWRELDFIFLPDTALAETRLERVDLTVNMVSFQEMTAEQTQRYVRRAYDLDSTYLYSLNRDRSRYNPQQTNVRAIIGELYWPHEVEVLPVSYTAMLDEARRRKGDQARGRALFDYHHLVGWKRLRT
jgi:hypothetical protein